MTFEEYKQELKKQIKELRKGWNNFLDLCCSSPHHLNVECFDFDINEILCAKQTQKDFDNTFQPYSLEELAFTYWLEDLENNIEHWEHGKWIENDDWNKEEE